ncbi:MAG: peptide-methionine (R)-S-oxide reductase MsrB [bacterium]
MQTGSAIGTQTRRHFIRLSSASLGAAIVALAPRRLVAAVRATTDPADVTIVRFSDAGVRGGVVTVPKVVKTDAEWRKQLAPLAYSVSRGAATERPFSGAYWNLHDEGLFRCVCCDNALFSSAHKFDSGTGWPSFWQPIAAENVVGPKGQHPGADPTEVCCTLCDAHLGDIFTDGPRPTGLRYCIDSVSLRFAYAA